MYTVGAYLRDYINFSDLKFYISGSAQPKLNQKNLNSIPIPLPPIAEQKRIVAKIEELRSRTQKAREALEVIPQMCDRFRQSVLAAAFRGDLTTGWREENPDVEAILDADIQRQKQYLEELEELKREGRNLPKLPTFEKTTIDLSIPTAWLTVTVESAALFIIDCLHSTPKFVENGEFCIDTTCIEPFNIDWNRARKVSSEDFAFRTSG